MAGFRWTSKREEGALLVAQDELSNEEIAKRMGVSRQGLDKWKRQLAFQERVAALIAASREAVRERGIAERQNRVAELNEEWNRLRRLRDARAVQYANVPGGDTGLIVRQVKVVRVSGGEDKETDGRGEGGRPRDRGFVEIEEYVLDLGLLRELREHGKQAAQELGQWDSGQVDEGSVLIREYVGVILEGV